MDSYLKIPLTLAQNYYEAFETVPVDKAIKQFIDILVSTRQGECHFNPDFGYSLWSNEFLPILNVMEWQPLFMEQIKELIEKYEPRITSVQVGEPEIFSIRKSETGKGQVVKTDKNYHKT